MHLLEVWFARGLARWEQPNFSAPSCPQLVKALVGLQRGLHGQYVFDSWYPLVWALGIGGAILFLKVGRRYKVRALRGLSPKVLRAEKRWRGLSRPFAGLVTLQDCWILQPRVLRQFLAERSANVERHRESRRHLEPSLSQGGEVHRLR